MWSTQPREDKWGATWKKNSNSGLETQEYDRRDPSHWPSGTLYPQKLALTSPTSGGRSVSMVCLWTQVTEFSFRTMTGVQHGSFTLMRCHYPAVSMFPFDSLRSFPVFVYFQKCRWRRCVAPPAPPSLLQRIRVGELSAQFGAVPGAVTWKCRFCEITSERRTHPSQIVMKVGAVINPNFVNH
jgi:hypothetical protein